MSVGIDYSLFWTLSPKKIKPFFKANDLRLERESIQRDTLAWLTGQYVMIGVSKLFSKTVEYPSHPFSLQKQQEQVSVAKPTDMSDTEAGYKYMLAFAAQFNAARRARQEK